MADAAIRLAGRHGKVDARELGADAAAPGPASASVASVHGVATLAQAPGELLLRGDGFLPRGHRIEAPIQPRAKVLPVPAHVPRGPVAVLVLAKPLRRGPD